MNRLGFAVPTEHEEQVVTAWFARHAVTKPVNEPPERQDTVSPYDKG